MNSKDMPRHDDVDEAPDQADHDAPPGDEPSAPGSLLHEAPVVVESRSWIRPTMFAIGAVLVIGLAASQIYLVTSLGRTQSDLDALAAEIASVDDVVSNLSDDVAAVAEVQQGSANVSPAPTVVDGFLPRFQPGTQDTALGLVLPEIAAVEAYSEETVTIDPSDGTKRVWLIWAHWCPYCQEELPMMAEWYPQSAEQFPNSELITVTTAMDPARGNPLDEYLAAQQFPLPVLRDEDGKLSARFGVSAFPFWVVTNGDGTVLYRTAGLLGVDQVEQLFTQLEQFDS